MLKKLTSLFALCLATVAALPGIAQAQECYKFQNTLFGPSVCAGDYFKSFYYWAVGIAIVGASIMIIFAGYKYTTSRGDQGAIKDAKEIIINVLVGLALLLLSYTILRFIGVNVQDV